MITRISTPISISQSPGMRRRQHIPASVTAWDKWIPSQSDLPALVRPPADRTPNCGIRAPRWVAIRTVREFISEFRGLSGTAKQAAVLDKVDLARAPLATLCAGGEFDKARIAELLAAMQGATKPVKPKLLGLIGKDHLARRMAADGAEMETFDYSRTFDVTHDGVPCVVEFAFAWCPEAKSRRLITGVNWSPGIANPFRQLGSYRPEPRYHPQPATRGSR